MKITVYHHKGQAVPCSFSRYKIYPGQGQYYVRTYGRFFSFLTQNVSPHSFRRGILARVSDWIVLHRKYSGKKVQRKEPTVQSNSSEPSLGRYNGQEDSETRS